MSTIIEKERENKFKAKLAIFIDFIEQEARRIDEEKRGAYRRDGGRMMTSTIFLKDFLTTVREETIKDILKVVEGMELKYHEDSTSPWRLTNDGNKYIDFQSFNTAISDILSLLQSKLIKE